MSACSYPSGRRREKWPIVSSRSTIRPPSAGSTATTRSSFPSRATSSDRTSHPGVEFIYAMDGSLTIHMSGDEHTLEAGDSIYFDSTIPHAYRRSGGRKCSAVVITAA